MKVDKKSIGMSRNRMLLFAGIVILLALWPQFLNDHMRGVSSKILLYVLLTASMNVINGYSGQFTVGQMGFACVGAFVTALLATHIGLSFWVCVVASGIAAALMGALISFPTRKLSGLYLAIVTLGFSEIVRVIALNWTSVTGGAMGIKGIPSAKLFGLKISESHFNYYIILGLSALMFLCTYCVIHSKIGRTWISIRENEQAAASLGINTYRYKALNFMYGAFWAGVAGSFMAVYYRYIDSTMFTSDENFNLLAMMIIGGQGTLTGPLVGAFLVNIILEVFRSAAQYRQVIYAVAIIAMMWLRPQGIMGSSGDGAGLVRRTIARFAKRNAGGDEK